MSTTAIFERLKAMDVLDDLITKFDALREKHGLAAAIEDRGDDVIFARALSRIVRPLIADYGTVPDEMWLGMVRDARDEATRQLIGGRHWRANSTDPFKNLISHLEASAMAQFVDDLRYFRLDA